jgi:tetrahydromethanopterin S-methyltransferase subunit G
MTSADDPLTGANERGAEQPAGLRARIASQAEDTIGKLADDLLENPVFNSALTTAFSAREKVAQAQQSAMGALNIPSASDVEKLARRLRSISQRLEEVEDGVDRVGAKLDAISDATESARELNERLDRIESRIDQLSREVGALRRESPAAGGLAGEPPAIVPEG